MHKNQSVNVHQFAMVPKADIPRSQFKRQHTHKTTFDAGKLIPIYLDEVLPGDSFSMQATLFCRLATPIVPVMDNLYLDTFWFFVPNRLVWKNWVKFMGEQDNPGDSISYVIPTITSKVGGYDVGSLYDYMGLPTVGQVGAGNTFTHSALFVRAYALIWNKWFRDENLVNAASFVDNDGPDTYTWYGLAGRMKRHDYFTSCLPWTQKGTSVPLPLGTQAPVIAPGNVPFKMRVTDDAGPRQINATAGSGVLYAAGYTGVGGSAVEFTTLNAHTGLYADLSSATAATINQIRQSFQIQKLLERDARGGTRYTEIVRSHFGVVSPDARLQRPEYLGGGTTQINMNPIAQTSASNITGGSTPAGSLTAFGTALHRKNGFHASFTEHGMIIGLACVRADLTYQQGLHKMWSRSTRYDFYFPAFANLGEQAVLNQEIYCDGSANDSAVFGYQERWAEYRYKPSQVTGLFRSTSAGTIDIWHTAQKFATLPALNSVFITEAPPLSRNLAVGTGANGQQIIMDGFFDCNVARPMPMYSVPGLIDHF